MIGKARASKEFIDISNISEYELASFYLGVKSIPCLINSPLRKDSNPSFALYSPSNDRVNYKDFATGEGGGLLSLLSKMWICDISEVRKKIYSDFKNPVKEGLLKTQKAVRVRKSGEVELQCIVREWKDYDIKYWEDFGISVKWLKYADVYPISHKIIIKEGNQYVFKADKYAYAYAEFKEGKTTLKIYQPFNKNGFKWSNNHDKSVISLWTKVPKEGNILCICASLKDALCLWANTGIPAVAIQGEGYSISNTAINDLKNRYKAIYIILDNDVAGIADSNKLSSSTGFKNIILPKISYLDNPKDISDLYKALKDKNEFKQLIYNLIKQY